MTHTEQHPSGTPAWVDVMVGNETDRLALMSFYRTLFDWTWEVGTEETGFYSIALHGGHPVMGLGQESSGTGTQVVYFATDDIDEATTKAAALGATVFMGPIKVMNQGSMALLADPVGAVHGLWQPVDFKGFGAMYEPNAPGWFDHASKDPDAAAHYYEALLGHKVSEPEPSMKILTVGDQWVASCSYDLIDRPMARWNPIYVVDSLSRIRDTVRELGGTVIVEEMPVPGSAICVVSEPVAQSTLTVMRAGDAPT